MDMVERIKSLCDSKGMSLTGLENVLNLGTSTIRRWNDKTPAVDKVLKVARYFNVSLDYLMGNTPYIDLETVAPVGFRLFQRAVKELSEEEQHRIEEIVKIFLNNK